MLFLTSTAGSLCLAACGGGGERSDVRADDAQVLSNVERSNISFATSGRLPGTWRWVDAAGGTPNIPVFLPQALNAIESDYAAKVRAAVGVVNAKLGGTAVLSIVTTPPASNHIRVGYGTAFVPPGPGSSQNFCANVSSGAFQSNPIIPNSNNGIGSNPVWVNVGNGQCDLTQQIVEHEFGHALGLADHFSGFGDGPATSSAYWDTLRTLYSNPASTVKAVLVVQRAGR